MADGRPWMQNTVLQRRLTLLLTAKIDRESHKPLATIVLKLHKYVPLSTIWHMPQTGHMKIFCMNELLALQHWN